MKNLLEKINDLNTQVLNGEALQAFETYYHDDVVMQENDQEPTVGKEANRKREEEFFGAITEFRGAEAVHVTVGDNVTMVKWHYDYTHKDWGERNYTQISVQEWKDGKIIKESFYYGS